MVDPLADERDWISPYNYVQNNPISRIDPDGMLDTRYEDEEGNVILNTDDGSNMIVTITDDKREGFDAAVRGTTDEAQDSPYWNFAMKSYLIGVKWNQSLENMMSHWATDDAQRSAIKFIQTGNYSHWWDAIVSHTNAYRDPVSIAASVTGALYGLTLLNGTLSSNIHSGKQGKHILGHNNYQKGKSVLSIDATTLLDDYHSGNIRSSRTINNTKVRVNFGKIIGDYVDPQTGARYPTSNGILINSKSGAHIVPARP